MSAQIKPTINDYAEYLAGALNYMDGLQLHTVLARFNVEANRGNPKQVFEDFINDFGNEFSASASEEVERKVVEICMNKDLGYIKEKIDNGLKDYVPPRIETNPLKRICNAQSRIASLVRKCSAEVGGVDVSEYCKQKALERLNVQSIKPEDKIKGKYNYSSEGSFNGKKLTLELVVSR